MGAVRPGEVVEPLPLPEFDLKIDVTLVAEELVELLLIGPMGPLDLAVQLGRTRLDVGVADAEVLDMPVELRLELVAVVGPDFSDAERELRDYMIDEVYGVRLGVAFIDLKRADPRCIVDRRVLETTNLLASAASGSGRSGRGCDRRRRPRS